MLVAHATAQTCNGDISALPTPENADESGVSGTASRAVSQPASSTLIFQCKSFAYVGTLTYTCTGGSFVTTDKCMGKPTLTAEAAKMLIDVQYRAIVPDGTETIADGAFESLGLKGILWGLDSAGKSSLVKIGANAFANNPDLRNIKLPPKKPGIKREIGKGAFSRNHACVMYGSCKMYL